MIVVRRIQLSAANRIRQLSNRASKQDWPMASLQLDHVLRVQVVDWRSSFPLQLYYLDWEQSRVGFGLQ